MTDRAARLIVSGVIFGLFGFIMIRHPDNALLVGALIAMATTAKDYWLGSSQDKKTDSPSGQPNDPVSTHEVKRP